MSDPSAIVIVLHNSYLILAAFLPPAAESLMIVKRMGATVMLTCTNNNPPTLASTIRWVLDGEVLQSLSLTDQSEENTVLYATQSDEGGVYQCQVLSARDSAILVVNVTVTLEGGLLSVYSLYNT